MKQLVQSKHWYTWQATMVFVVMFLGFQSCVSLPEEEQVVPRTVAITRIVDSIAVIVFNDPGIVGFLPLAGLGNGEDESKIKDFSNFLTDNLASTTSRKHREIRIVERSAMENILIERGIMTTGIINDDKMIDFKDFAAARYLISGTFRINPDHVQVIIRVIDGRDATLAGTVAARIALDVEIARILNIPLPGSPELAMVDSDVPGVVPGTVVRNILYALQAESFDEGKLAVLSSGLVGKPIAATQIKAVLEMFTFDDGKLAALELLIPGLVDGENGFILLQTLTFDSSKERLRILLSN